MGTTGVMISYTDRVLLPARFPSVDVLLTPHFKKSSLLSCWSCPRFTCQFTEGLL